MRAGFSGGLVVDFPHSTRAKKYFLVLMVGASAAVPQAKGLDAQDPENDSTVDVIDRQQPRKRQKGSQQVNKVSSPFLRRAWAICSCGHQFSQLH